MRYIADAAGEWKTGFGWLAEQMQVQDALKIGSRAWFATTRGVLEWEVGKPLVLHHEPRRNQKKALVVRTTRHMLKSVGEFPPQLQFP